MRFAAYAAKKAELAEERKRREAERAAAKEARQQAMRDYMEHNFLQVPHSLSLSCDTVPTTPVAPCSALLCKMTLNFSLLAWLLAS